MKTNIRLSVLTLHRRRPGAVVEDGELSEHFARSHRAQLHPLLRHLHLPLWARDSHTQQDRERERERTKTVSLSLCSCFLTQSFG